jgi:hypothetical protein
VAREGLEVADVFRRFGPAFRDRHGASLSTARWKAMRAIENCRTAVLGGHVERCGDCGHQRVAYNSCRNRNCPKCQGLARARWLEDRQAELLDVPYFHVVFTVPAEIEAIAFQNQTVVYDILFRAASETLRTIAADPKHLGAEIGFLAVLHTWGQNLMHHPLEPWNRHDVEGALALMMDKQTLIPKRIDADLASSLCGADMALIRLSIDR